MFEITCEECSSPITMDYQASLEDYLYKVNYVTNDITYITDTAIKTHMIYKCYGCGKVFKYTLEDIELKTRQSIHKDVRKYRKIYVFRNILNPANVDPDNGLLFCGICDGVDNLGNCYTDIVNICPFVCKNEA
jgi:DNA-directed RNA polymerase subunit RPC12/RpoP